MLEHLEGIVIAERAQLVERIEQASHSLAEKIADLKKTSDRYKQLKGKVAKEELDSLKARIAVYKRGLSRDMHAWKELCNRVLQLEPSAG